MGAIGRSVLIGAALMAQPVLAQEIVIKCTGTSTMTIYNPHGQGGTIGGPSDRTWTIRTDGKTATLMAEGGKIDNPEPYSVRDVELSFSGLSFCGTRADLPCDYAKPSVGSDGFARTTKASRITVSTDGTYKSNFFTLTDTARMKTGVTVEDMGICDRESVTKLRRLAEGDGEPEVAAVTPVEDAKAAKATALAAARAKREAAAAEQAKQKAAELAATRRAEQEALETANREQARLAAESSAKIKANLAAAEAAKRDFEAKNRDYEARMKAYAEATAAHELAVKKAAAQQAQWQADMAACKAGDRAKCSAGTSGN